MKMKRVLNYLLICIFLLSCAKEEFAPTTRTNVEAVSIQETFTFNSDCSNNFTLVKPPVDFLFIFDNSTSTNFITPETKAALRNTINYVSENFNYHIMVAPLLTSTANVNEGASLTVTNTDGLTSTAVSMVVPNDSNQLLDRVAAIQTQPGSQEFGFARAVDLISSNRSNGIFRQDAYTIVVTISNENADWVQTGPGQQGNAAERADFTSNRDNLIGLSNSLNSEQFRYMSLVPAASECQPFFKNGWRYREMSQAIYTHNQTSKPGFVDPSPKADPDNFDICSGNYDYIFTQLNQTIQAIVLNHTYDHWKIASTTDPSFDPISLRVFKQLDNTNRVEILESPVNGYQYIGLQTNLNTRILPTPGEPQTGFMLRLNGSAQVTFPECLVIQALATADHFGYAVASEEPDLSSVVFKKNGQSFGQSTTSFSGGKTDGWEYLGFQTNFNIRISGPGDFTPATPAVNRTGYIFKLNGNAGYTNGDSISLDYFPLPK